MKGFLRAIDLAERVTEAIEVTSPRSLDHSRASAWRGVEPGWLPPEPGEMVDVPRFRAVVVDPTRRVRDTGS